jgi:glycosyltransferase involved in cell wall biosynthesis
MMTFAVVIPTKNEKNHISALSRYIDEFEEIIFVDANSNDGTIEAIQKNFPDSILLEQGDFKGKGSALILGLLKSSADYLIILDADMPISVSEIRAMKQKFRDEPDIDLIKTSRHLPGGGSEDLTPVRNFGAIFFAFLTRIIYRTNWTEMCYGFWGIKNSKIEELNLNDLLYNTNESINRFLSLPYGHSFELDQIVFLRSLKRKFRIEEIASYEKKRIFGNTNLSALRDGFRTTLVIFNEKLHK